MIGALRDGDVGEEARTVFGLLDDLGRTGRRHDAAAARAAKDLLHVLIGDRCALAYRVDADALVVTIARGLDAGLVLHAGSRVTLAGDHGGRLLVRFTDAGVRIRAEGAALFLNGVNEHREVEPLQGDTLELGSTRWTVA